MIQTPQEDTPSSNGAAQGELDDENGIAAQAARQGAGDFDPDAPLPDDGSGMPLDADETLSVEDDDDLEDDDLDDDGLAVADDEDAAGLSGDEEVEEDEEE